MTEHRGSFPPSALLILLLFAAPLFGQAPANPMAVPAKQWATESAAQEIHVLDYGRSYLRYKLHSRDTHGDMVRDTVQTKDGVVARMVMRDGRPLTADEDAAEHSRLQAMLDSPSSFSKHVKNDATERKLATDMIKQMPEAMLYTYAAGQPQRAGHEHADPQEIVLDFKPNPDWHPPTMTADALTGLQGRIWIDPRSHYMTRMDAEIFRGINFGLGFLAHIYPGGKLMFEQSEAAPNRWSFSRFVERVNVRVIVKTIKEDSNLEGYEFAPVPELTYQQAIKLLWESPLPH